MRAGRLQPTARDNRTIDDSAVLSRRCSVVDRTGRRHDCRASL